MTPEEIRKRMLEGMKVVSEKNKDKWAKQNRRSRIIRGYDAIGEEIPDDLKKEYDIKDIIPKTKKAPKEYKEEKIMKGESELTKGKNGKYSVETELDIKKDLEPKVKRALKKSIISATEKELKGYGIRKKIDLDYSSDEDKPMRKGKGYYYDSDSSSDEEDLKEYSKILKHLISHITDKKEKIDKLDVKQAKELIDKIKNKKK